MFRNEDLLPLIVDLDGTLTPTDTLFESLILLAKESPLRFLCLPFALFKGRACFKDAISSTISIDAEHLPYHQDFIDYLSQEKLNGRKIVLATAAHHSIAQKVAAHLGLFDHFLASNLEINLKGIAKLQAIREKISDHFIYAGDSKSDLPIWQAAQSAILVGVTPSVAEEVRKSTPIECEFPAQKANFKDWLRALRVHQWVKNLLLFVPLLTAFSFFDFEKIREIGAAFIAFSLAASATYIVNDLWDLNSDRQHLRKRHRPFASAKLSIPKGVGVAFLALAVAFILAFSVSKAFVLMLLLYVFLTSIYSWVLKSYVLIDVLMLSLLYTFRILTGSVAVRIPTSSWLLAFSVFLFLSLALVKRCAELVSLNQVDGNATKGRDYRVTDLIVLWPMGVGSALSAVVVFGLFISSPETYEHYGSPQLLWLVAIGLIYWLGRLWIKTSRGEMHDDPVVYVFKDGGSRTIIFGIIVVMLIAHFFRLNAFV
jgi:4-hydroxybenzoate polyprenyltransferase/phosphoserine phosphatase